MSHPPHYLVKWEIDIFAATPELAAKEAMRIQKSLTSIAHVYDVTDADTLETTRIDLDNLS